MLPTNPSPTAGSQSPSVRQSGASLPTLVAMDDSEPSDAAVRVAAALAAAGRLTPSALSVNRLTPLAIGAPLPSTAAVVGALLGEERETEWTRSVRKHAFDVALAAAEWPIRFAIGDPARAIDDTAVDIGAALVIMGLQHHGLVARVARDETTLNVIRRGHVPVLGVTQ
jgi:nucleotide-binding universal stress UspA family protein